MTFQMLPEFPFQEKDFVSETDQQQKPASPLFLYFSTNWPPYTDGNTNTHGNTNTDVNTNIHRWNTNTDVNTNTDENRNTGGNTNTHKETQIH